MNKQTNRTHLGNASIFLRETKAKFTLNRSQKIP